MRYPKNVPGLSLAPAEQEIFFRLWEAKGRVLTYTQMHEGTRNSTLTLLSRIRRALRDTGALWLLETDRDAGGARLVQIAKMSDK